MKTFRPAMPKFPHAAAIPILAGLAACQMFTPQAADTVDTIDTVYIANTPPRASAGMDSTYFILDTAWLDGGGSSDPERDTLWYFWMPPNHLAMEPIFTSEPRFPILPGRTGDFTFTLMAYDGKAYSPPAKTTIRIRGADIVVTKRPGKFPGMKAAASMAEALSLRDTARTDTILVDTGTYAGGVRNFVSNTHIYGLDPERTILDAGGAGTSGLTLERVHDVSLRGLTITGGGGLDPDSLDVAGILCLSSSAVSIQGCRIINSRADGIRLVGCEDVRLADNTIGGNTGNGIRGQSSSFQLLRNAFAGNGDDFNDTNTRVENMTAAVILEHLPGIISNQSVVVEGNHFHPGKTKKPGVSIKGAYRVEMRENRFHDIHVCLYCHDGTNATVSVTRDLFENVITPIFCKGAASISITGSRMQGGRSAVQKGIEILECSASTITDNRIENYRIGVLARNSAIEAARNILVGIDTAFFTMRSPQVPLPAIQPMNSYQVANHLDDTGGVFWVDSLIGLADVAVRPPAPR
jgi:parallel beta-helix repeat protein